MVYDLPICLLLDVTYVKKSKSRGIIASSFAVSVFVIFTKAVGFIKQAVIAACYGATAETDAFFLASGFMASFGLMIFSSLSVTLLTMYVREKERGEVFANQLVNSTLKLFIPVSLALSFLLFVFSDAVAFVLAPAYDAGSLAVVSYYLRLLCIVVFLYCPYLILNAVLEANKVFLAGRVLALLQSVFLIIAALAFSSSGDVIVLIIAFALASVINLVYIALRAARYVKYDRSAPLWSPEMKTLLELMLPVLLGNAVLEVNSIAEKAVASALGEGSVSALTYGWSVYEIVTGVIISALATVLFSYFAGYLAKDDIDGMTRCLEKCNTTLTLILIPVTVVTVLCADDIVSVLYLRGNFDDSARNATSLVVSTYALGFVPTAIRSVLTKAHYAFQDSTTPMYNGITTVAVGAAGAAILAVWCNIGIAGVGIAVSFSMALSAALYQRSIAKRLPACRFDGEKAVFAGKCVVAGLVSFVAGILIRKAILLAGFSSALVTAAISLICVAAVAFAVFFAVAYALHVKEIPYVFSMITARIRRNGEE